MEPGPELVGGLERGQRIRVGGVTLVYRDVSCLPQAVKEVCCFASNEAGLDKAPDRLLQRSALVDVGTIPSDDQPREQLGKLAKLDYCSGRIVTKVTLGLFAEPHRPRRSP
jgi:hypothetical protein